MLWKLENMLIFSLLFEVFLVDDILVFESFKDGGKTSRVAKGFLTVITGGPKSFDPFLDDKVA